MVFKNWGLRFTLIYWFPFFPALGKWNFSFHGSCLYSQATLHGFHLPMFGCFFYIGECKGSKDLGFLPLTMQVKGPMQNCPHISLEGNKDKPMCLLLLGIPNVSQKFKMQNGFPFKTGHLASIRRTAQPFWWASARFLRAQLGPRKHRNIWGAQFQPRKHLHEISLVSNNFFLFGDTCHSNMIPFFM